MEQTQFAVGNRIRVDAKVKEGGKERIQSFEGTVISMRGEGNSKTFTVRKIASDGVGVERIWPVGSPTIAKITVKKTPKVKRAKLFYLRKLTGKAALGV
ncbi:MAG: 50S ribosomal protein L19 [bacterium]|nr:50S ribosomal protein L19 [bacterium]